MWRRVLSILLVVVALSLAGCKPMAGEVAKETPKAAVEGVDKASEAVSHDNKFEIPEGVKHAGGHIAKEGVKEGVKQWSEQKDEKGKSQTPRSR